MGDASNAERRVVSEQFLAQRGDHQALASSGREDDQRIASAFLPIGIEGVEGGALVWAKG